MVSNVLSIAGSDPSGGAGIQADLKTFAAMRCYGMAVVTALTAQNTRGVTAVHVPPADFLGEQIDAIFADIDVAAVKIGMLANGAIARLVAARLRRYRPRFIVLDPVLVATSGDSLGTPDTLAAMREDLIPVATLVTPNIPEAARLADRPLARDVDDMRRTAEVIYGLGAPAVLVKGGHLHGAMSEDVLFDGSTHHVLSSPRVDTQNTHGTGCTLSSAIAAALANGLDLAAAVASAKIYLTAALEASDALRVGHGHGPVHHFYALWAEGARS
jgi:hydroxymethylpyrimidine kinase/phosphomethylpyrimidine kinase